MTLTQNFWDTLARLGSGAGVLADWAWHAGPALDWLRPFLVPAPDRAEHHPCRANPPCSCYHAVRPSGSGWVAACLCPPGECEPFVLEPADLVVWQPDYCRLTRALCEALGLNSPDPVPARERLVRVGRFHHHAVYWYAGFADAFDAGSFAGPLAPEPFVLLTTTGSFLTDSQRAFLESQGVLHLGLDRLLEPLARGAFKAVVSFEQTVAPWAAALGKGRRPGPALDRIHRELQGLRTALATQPAATPPLSDSAACQVFGMLQAMEDGGQWRKAPPVQVFRLYCLQHLTAQQIARKLGCAKSLIVLRLATLQKKLGRHPAEMRAYAARFEQIENSLNDPRARHVHRRGLTG